MRYRFQKFTTVYDVFLEHFLGEAPFFFYEHLPFRELYDKFISSWYSLSNFYARHMEAMGNPAQDLFASIEPLQKAWARENRCKYGKDSWQKDIVLAQVASFQPDVLYLQDLSLFDQTFREQLRGVSPKPMFLIGWRGAPSGDFATFNDLDLVLAPVPNFVKLLQDNGAKAALNLLAFEESILEIVDWRRKRDLDFVFAGSVGNRKGTHAQRYTLIEKLLATTPLQVWGQVNEFSSPKSQIRRFIDNAIYQSNRTLSLLGVPNHFKAKIPLVRRGIFWEENPSWPTLSECYPGRINPSVFGMQYYKLLARARITLNVHADMADNYAGNMRLFEATGMGSCLITEWKENLPDLFDPETEVVTYRSTEECIEKVRYLLDHESERQAIASAGQKRTLADHTFAKRVTWLDQRIKNSLKKC